MKRGKPVAANVRIAAVRYGSRRAPLTIPFFIPNRIGKRTNIDLKNSLRLSISNERLGVRFQRNI